MEISAKAVMELRAKTNVSMMACKKALVQANGDQDAAIDILRKSGEAKALSKADRETHEGIITAYISSDNKKGVLTQVLCETDFVARSDDFINMAEDITNHASKDGTEAAKAAAVEKLQQAVITLGENIQLENVEELTGDFVGMYIHANKKVGAIVSFEGNISEEAARDVAMQVVASQPQVVNPEDMDSSLVEKEAEIAKEQLRKEGKPEAMLDKIIEGKLKKFREENALLTQAFIKDPSKQVKDTLGGAKIMKFVRFAV
ncbi:MAG: translation elongation factor Ts [Candidatus Gracilibacteria bacterium]